MAEICVECEKPIEHGQPSWYSKRSEEDIGRSYHSGCGDPFGIKAAVAAERELWQRKIEQMEEKLAATKKLAVDAIALIKF